MLWKRDTLVSQFAAVTVTEHLSRLIPYSVDFFCLVFYFFFFFQAEDGIRDHCVTGVQTCALPISARKCVATIRRRSGRSFSRVWRWSGVDAFQQRRKIESPLFSEFVAERIEPSDRKSVV